ncbi:Microbial collagenase precursor [Rubripirellula tenax]|uniref:Microbial collagenase n=1 Tax=Rubripirellula tenax TaxID=2528015 RepID=A0A5C6E7P6_9BACT|nr:PKD domain-containing protein [Rubripirellula tenax]TWU44585.1 Microbial collagenase precursor [Rubripirellula tenax]
MTFSFKPLVSILALRAMAVMLATAACLSISVMAQDTATYTVIDLGVDVVPAGLNDNGEVVGSIRSQGYYGPSDGFYFSLVDGLVMVPDTTEVSAINDAGDFVGSMNLGMGEFVSSGDEILPFGPGYTAAGINEVGQIAGSQDKDNPFRPTPRPMDPAIYDVLTRQWTAPNIAGVYSRGTRKGVYADLYRLKDVNDFGIAVGVKSRSGLYGSSSILIATGDSAATFLPISGGGEAYAINNLGQVAGRTGTVSGVYSAYLYDLMTDSAIDLGVASGASSVAYDVNDAGQVVGSDSNGGFIWQGGQLTNLNSQLDPAASFTITSAQSINERGDIAAVGTVGGESHGLLLITSTPNDVGGGGGATNETPTSTIINNRTKGRTRTKFLFDGRTSTDTDGTIESYAWDFGDGETSDLSKIRHQYASAGTYTATLTVTDNDGATATANVEITVRP